MLDCPNCQNPDTQRGAPGGWRWYHPIGDLLTILIMPFVLWAVVSFTVNVIFGVSWYGGTDGVRSWTSSDFVFLGFVAFCVYCVGWNWRDRWRRDSSQWCPRCGQMFAPQADTSNPV